MKSLSIRMRISAYLLAVSMLVLVAAILAGTNLRASLKEDELLRRAESLRGMLDFRLETKFDVGLTNAVTMAADPGLINALIAGDLALAADAVKRVRQAYGKYTNYQGIQVHLFDRSGMTFFDSAKRPPVAQPPESVVKVLTERKTRAFFERDGLGNVLIRAFAPIVSGEEVLGVVEMTQGVGSISRDFGGDDIKYLMLLDKSRLKESDPAFGNRSIGGFVVANDKWFEPEVEAFAKDVWAASALLEGHRIHSQWFAVAVPVKDSTGNLLAVHLLGVPADKVLADLDKATRIADVMLGAMVLLVILVLLVTILLIRALVVRPINDTVHALAEIAQGDGDLRHRLPVIRDDELGQLAMAFNRFSEKIQIFVRQVADNTNLVAQAGTALHEQTLKTRDGAERQQAEVERVASAVTELTAAVDGIADNAKQAMLASESGAQQVDHVVAEMNKLLDAITAHSAEIEKATGEIASLESESAAIGGVIQVIREISDQTNLLALNAAIEAARAGEQGRGFAVVADEVRTLASRTNESTHSIQSTVERLQGRTRAAVTSMRENRARALSSLDYVKTAHKSLEDLAVMMVSVRDLTSGIASATLEEDSATHDISRSIDRIQGVADASTQSAKDSDASAADLKQLAQSMQQQVGRFKY